MENLEFKSILNECKNTKDINVVIQGAIEVAKSNNPYYICDFVEEVALADSPEIMPILERAICETRDYVHIYEFAFLTNDMGMKNVYNEGLLQTIVLSLNPKLMAYCLEYIPAMRKDILLYALGECGNKKWIEHVLSQENIFDGIEESKKQELLERLKNRYEYALNNEVLPHCVEHLEGLDVEKIAQYAIESKNPYIINEVAENVVAGKGDVDLFLDKIIETGDILHIYEFGASVPNAKVSKVEKAAIDSGMPKYMYYVGAYVPNADAERMYDAIKKTKSEKYAKMMLDHIKGTSQLD